MKNYPSYQVHFSILYEHHLKNSKLSTNHFFCVLCHFLIGCAQGRLCLVYPVKDIFVWIQYRNFISLTGYKRQSWLWHDRGIRHNISLKCTVGYKVQNLYPLRPKKRLLSPIANFYFQTKDCSYVYMLTLNNSQYTNLVISLTHSDDFFHCT